MSDISYDWNFNPLEVVYNEDVLQNVVHTVHWQYIATHPSASQQAIGTVSLEAPISASFHPVLPAVTGIGSEKNTTFPGSSNGMRLIQG